MFTGIITHLATIEEIKIDKKKDCLLIVSLNKKQVKRSLEIGCSIALSGICLTLVTKNTSAKNILLSFEVSQETINKTNFSNWKKGDKVNVEFSLRMGDEMGGHMVSGHVEGVAKIVEIKKIKTSHRLTFEAPNNFGKSIIGKGSVAINGVSLTVNEVNYGKTKTKFDVNIIPHTLEKTTFSQSKISDLVNLETDMMVKYQQNKTPSL